MSSALRLDHEQPPPVLRTADDYVFRHHVFIDERPAESGGGVAAALALGRRRYLTRRHLATLDAHGLADIGLDAAARNREAVKYFWQA